MDKLAEAYRRFEDDVDTKEITSYRELEAKFLSWKGISKGSKHWPPTSNQTQGLYSLWSGKPFRRRPRLKARRVAPEVMMREMYRARRFSQEYASIRVWRQETHSSAYRQRIESYMRRHPEASLSEARGHKR